MLRLRRGQLHVLEEVLPPPSDEQLCARVRERSPQQSALLGDPCVLAAVQLAQERAAFHGLRDRRGVLLYVDLVFMLGSHFDRDPLLPWAAAILADRTLGSSRARMDALYGRAVAYREAAYGALNEHLNAAVSRIHACAADVADALSEQPFEPAEARTIAEAMAQLFPQKHRTLGAPQVDAALLQLAEAAAAEGIVRSRDVGIFFGLAFLLGGGFHHDPLYPWARAALDAGDDGAAKADGLLRAGLAFVAAQLS
jgi:hypothetical protein